MKRSLGISSVVMALLVIGSKYLYLMLILRIINVVFPIINIYYFFQSKYASIHKIYLFILIDILAIDPIPINKICLIKQDLVK